MRRSAGAWTRSFPGQAALQLGIFAATRALPAFVSVFCTSARNFDECPGFDVHRQRWRRCRVADVGGDVPVSLVSIFKAKYGSFGGLVDIAVQDGVDDAAGVLDWIRCFGAVPAGADEVGLCAALSIFDEFRRTWSGCSFEELPGRKQAEKVGGLGDAAPVQPAFSFAKAGQEVVLGLLRGQDGDGRQNAECVSGQEDDVRRRERNRADDLLNVVDGVGNILFSVTDLSAKSILPSLSKA